MKFPLRRPSVLLFLAVQTLIWLVFLTLDLRHADTTLLKYGSIALCLFFSLLESAGGGDPLVTAALFFTLAADTFLLLLDRFYALGIVLFCIVQALYLVRLYRISGGHTYWPLRGILLLTALAVLQVLDLLNPLNALALFYFTNFFANVVLSFRTSGPASRLFSVGLALFLCCDLCVGTFNQPDLIPRSLQEPVRLGMWFFYLPAQVLIVLSAHPESANEGDAL